MSRENIVSIITPCYNGQRHIKRYLDSILAQTYSHIELIFVNDGSTDLTEDIVFSFKENFENKGIKLIYIHQENKGLGSAINAGLSRVTGKYLCWPDADDYLEPESVELRSQILEKNQDFAVVTSDAYIRSIDNLNVSLGLVSSNFATNDDPDQFFHLLTGKSIFCSGTHMVRTDTFFETHPLGEIYPAKKGQNWQMLLPIYYRHKRFFLNKPLYNYIKYGTSMSRIDDESLNESISRNNHHREILMETISRMEIPENEKTHYLNITKARYSYMNFYAALKHKNLKLLNQEYCNLKEQNKISIKIRLHYFITRFKHTF